ncbi:MAG: hypothetical protein JJD92_13180 [Frankiaceae bacterium]|nr:hypothetical protein [Frankiaceae bacterium]
MKRTALIATLALVAVSPAVAHAKPAKASKRTLTFSYSNPVGITSPAANGALNCQGPMAACWDFTTVKGEKTVAVSAKDSTGTPIGLQVFTDDTYDSVQTFCGSGTITVSAKSATPVSVRAAFDPSCQALPTSGTFTAVITNK